MNVSQIKRSIDSNSYISPSVRGVLSRDHLPSIVTRYPWAYVVNMDFSHQHGKHLIVIDLPNTYHGVFFDSLGRKLEVGEENSKTS